MGSWRWKALVLFAAAAGVVQWLIVVDRITHLLTMLWKFGPDAPLISTGRDSLLVFSVLTGICVSAALLAQDRLKRDVAVWRMGSMAVAQALIGGALVWIGLASSPLVDVRCRACDSVDRGLHLHSTAPHTHR